MAVFPSKSVNACGETLAFTAWIRPCWRSQPRHLSGEDVTFPGSIDPSLLIVYQSMNASTTTSFPKKRSSSSAEASRAAEIRRVRGMSVEERIKEALSLSRRFCGLIQTHKDYAHGSGV
ncbi:MAG: hypothetical protein ACFCUX_06330 [Candidatus Methylacidiphilales bacterium]